MKYNVYKIEPKFKQKVLMASFELLGNVVDATWVPGFDKFKNKIESKGIYVGGDVFRISDGRDFLLNIPVAFMDDPTILVEDGEPINRFVEQNSAYLSVFDANGKRIA